jgi:hypothetical protein
MRWDGPVGGFSASHQAKPTASHFHLGRALEPENLAAFQTIEKGLMQDGEKAGKTSLL